MNNLNDSELMHFKRYDFRAIAASMGYELDPDKSGGSSFVLKSENDRVVVKQVATGDWVYFALADTSDNGSVIDFVQRRLGGSIGHVRRAIRNLIGSSHHNTSLPYRPDVDLAPTTNTPTTTVDHHKKALAVWDAATWQPEPTYLLHRGLAPATLNDPRFNDCCRVNKRGTVLFPHFDRSGICGYEYRSADFKGFGRDVHKGLWFSRNAKSADEIVVCESQIDCLSHFQLHGGSQGYVSHNGALGALQVALMASVFVKAHERHATVIIATDNDQAGEDFHELFQSIAPMELERLIPISKDWNEDVLYVNRENQ